MSMSAGGGLPGRFTPSPVATGLFQLVVDQRCSPSSHTAPSGTSDMSCSNSLSLPACAPPAAGLAGDVQWAAGGRRRARCVVSRASHLAACQSCWGARQGPAA
jgi:hypothetical protein